MHLDIHLVYIKLVYHVRCGTLRDTVVYVGLSWYMITTLEMSEVSSVRASRVIDDQTVLAWDDGCQMLKYMDRKSRYQLNLISISMDNSLSHPFIISKNGYILLRKGRGMTVR